MTTPQHYGPPPGVPPSTVSQLGEDDELEDNVALAHLISEVKDYQLTHGNLLKLVRFEEPTRVPTTGVNISCQPTKFPTHFFDQAMALQQPMQELYLRALSDTTWLYSVLGPQIESEPDGVMAKLWNIHMRCEAAGPVQEFSCGLFRSDYMLNETASSGSLGDAQKEVTLKQVEMNTFSCAGACHGEIVGNMHQALLRRRLAEDGIDPTPQSVLPTNTNTSDIVNCLAMAHRTYESQFGLVSAHITMDDRRTAPQRRCVLMIVQPYNFNVADERPIEYGLWKDVNVPCYRCEWQDIPKHAFLGGDRALFYRPLSSKKEYEVSVVYYRAGYDLREYADDIEGSDIRYMLETSRAIKCPDILGHLVGFKSVQRALAEAGVVERFSTGLDGAQVAAVKDTFMSMYALGDMATDEGKEVALDHSFMKDYVLKPNLEGGGNNIFSTDIPAFLEHIPLNDWHRYNYQRLITPPAETTGILLTTNEIYQGPVVSELGILGLAMWRRDHAGKEDVKIFENKAIGFTFKTKPTDVDEMSVVKGYGCFDTPMLV
ncbi:hypothetical protein LTR62_001723 [Meristemomyces frigidus]|uniref:Glutathione synthetase n=1 Tax=Meristemomyces frigidus TaxID=1508187 RepID=A0AAN7YQE8_9PEZI|nr:hypothetical protein LTR62_001723 [Meristemomyces frigidus]